MTAWNAKHESSSIYHHTCIFLLPSCSWTITLPPQPQQADFCATSPAVAWSCWLILIPAGCNEYIATHSTWWRKRHQYKYIFRWIQWIRNSNTSDLESVSASLCFISFAIEKKTSSTFRFVFALWNRFFFQ